MTPITETRPPARRGSNPPRDEKEKKSTGNLPRQRHKTFRQSGSLSQQTRTPRAAPHVSSHFGFPVPCRAPWGWKKKILEAVSGRGCRAAFPGASQRGPLPAPSAQAILGKGRRGFDRPWVSGTGPRPAVELGPLVLTSEPGFFSISICFPCDGSPSQGGLGEISLTGRNPSQRGCKTDGRAHGSVGRDGQPALRSTREKGGGTGDTPASQAPTDLFSPSSRTIPATPTTAEKKPGSEVWGQDDALPDPSYFEHGLIYPAAGFEAIERGADPKVRRQFHFAGKPHTHSGVWTQLQLLTGGTGEQHHAGLALSHKIKKTPN